MSSRTRLPLAVALLGVVAGCGAARVVFDVPEPEESEQQEVDGPRPNGVQQQAATTREPLPLELTLDPDSALALLPRDAAGGVDWVAAVNTGVLDPAATDSTLKRSGQGFGFDFYFGEMETAFPHSSHVAWLSCESCHPQIYRTRGNKTTMAEISNGESCGVCHGSVAFGVEVCERCHPAAALPEGRLEASLESEYRIPRDTTLNSAVQMAGSLPESVFPHWIHRIRFQCSACHPGLFSMEPGGSTITMESMQAGENCGSCHNGADAFGVMECGRCHAPEPSPEEASGS